MWSRIFTGLLCMVPFMVSPAICAQTYDRAQIGLFHSLKRQPDDLARYAYLTLETPRLSGTDQSLAMQMLASVECELGLYDQAVFEFPLALSPVHDLVLPTPSSWQAKSAVDVITRMAAHRRIVMINEAHHDAHTRLLTLALLPRLRALGFNYFAAEALSGDDPDLMKRGYPVQSSGTEYLHEPIYGEIVRTAIQLGFTVVAYDSDAGTDRRDIDQADTLYQKVFAKDPHARLFVHAGYAHIDKARGRLGNVDSMTMQLARLTGMDPLSIDQTQFLEDSLNTRDAYHQLVESFHPTTPIVLLSSAGNRVWSAQPKLYDVNVILPPSLNMKAFGDENMYGHRADEHTVTVNDTARFALNSPTLNRMLRPAWLTLDGQRVPYPISVTLCRNRNPCVVEAHYANETANSVAADRYAFLKEGTVSQLYLRKGRYRLRAWNGDGNTLSEKIIQIGNPRSD